MVCDAKKIDAKGCRGAPDLVVEILSPSNASHDAIRKRRLYEQHGVKEFWLIDPSNRLVTRYTLGAAGRFGAARMYGDTGKIRPGLFPGLVIDLVQVFPRVNRVVTESPGRYAARRRQK